MIEVRDFMVTRFGSILIEVIILDRFLVFFLSSSVSKMTELEIHIKNKGWKRWQIG